jgi:hypothetical protein
MTGLAAFIDIRSQLVASVPLGELLLWGGLVALSVAIIVLLRARWGQSRPLQKCAVLSLLVHVLLACAAMTVKIVVGDGDVLAGAGGPIRVRVIEGDGPLVATTREAMAPPDLIEHVPVEIVPEEAEIQPADPPGDRAPTEVVSPTTVAPKESVPETNVANSDVPIESTETPADVEVADTNVIPQPPAATPAPTHQLVDSEW